MKSSNKINSLKEESKKNTKKAADKIKKTAKKGKEKIDEVRQSSRWKKTKEMAKKTASNIGSRLATLKSSITLSNEEAKLMEKLKKELNKKDVYPSKSEILRAGLWSLKNKNPEELEELVKDLFKVKQMRIL